MEEAAVESKQSARDLRKQKLMEYLASKGRLKPPNPRPYLRSDSGPKKPRVKDEQLSQNKENQRPPLSVINNGMLKPLGRSQPLQRSDSHIPIAKIIPLQKMCNTGAKKAAPLAPIQDSRPLQPRAFAPSNLKDRQDTKSATARVSAQANDRASKNKLSETCKRPQSALNRLQPSGVLSNQQHKPKHCLEGSSQAGSVALPMASKLQNNTRSLTVRRTTWDGQNKPSSNQTTGQITSSVQRDKPVVTKSSINSHLSQRLSKLSKAHSVPSSIDTKPQTKKPSGATMDRKVRGAAHQSKAPSATSQPPIWRPVGRGPTQAKSLPKVAASLPTAQRWKQRKSSAEQGAPSSASSQTLSSTIPRPRPACPGPSQALPSAIPRPRPACPGPSQVPPSAIPRPKSAAVTSTVPLTRTMKLKDPSGCAAPATAPTKAGPLSRPGLVASKAPTINAPPPRETKVSRRPAYAPPVGKMAARLTKSSGSAMAPTQIQTPATQNPTRSTVPQTGLKSTQKLTSAQEERMRKLQQWREERGIVYKRPSMPIRPSGRKSTATQALTQQHYWATIEAEDQLHEFVYAVDRSLSDCLKLLDKGCSSDQVLEVLSRVPMAQKFCKYWMCRARLMEREGDLEVLPLFEEAVREVKEPVDDLRTVIFEILKKKETAAQFKDVSMNKESCEEAEEDIIPATPKTVTALIRGEKGNSSVVKYKITATPGRHPSQSKKPLHVGDQEVRFFTPVRRSVRIEKSASRYPSALQEKDQCVASSRDLSSSNSPPSNTVLYLYRENDALGDQVQIELFPEEA